jgi:hypothetical protein
MKKVSLGFALVTLASALLLLPATGAAGHLDGGSADALGLMGFRHQERDASITPSGPEVPNVTDDSEAAPGDSEPASDDSEMTSGESGANSGGSGPATDDLAHVLALIRPWCGEVPLTLRDGSGGEAGFTRSWHPVFARGGDVTEYIKIGLSWPADHPATAAVALHECAHILQYRTYGYDWASLDTAMRRVYPDGPHSPVEHMADCMSEVMGAERRGRSEDGQWYDAGYGGSCSPTQSAAAAQVVSGQRL